MHDHELFLRTVHDLSEKTFQGTQYDWLRASALVRQLLVDGHPLVDRVNRDYRLKLTFEVPVASVPVGTLLWMAGDAPGDAPLPTPTRTVDREGFLSAKVIYFMGRWFTVHDVIDTAAHALGGVHKGEPRGDAQRGLAEINASLRNMGGGPAIYQVRGIGHMTITGLKPLTQVVNRKLGLSLNWPSASGIP